MTRLAFAPSLVAALLLASLSPARAATPTTPTTAPSTDPSTQPAPVHAFENEIAAFEAADKLAPPPANPVLFIGDSGFSMWTTLADDFPGTAVLNRGFGGSQMPDATYYVGRIVVPYHPRLIILREGGNDLTAGKSSEQLLADFKDFVARIRQDLPETRIALFSLNPNPARWNQAEKRKAANVLLKTWIQTRTHLAFIEIWDEFLAPDGKPREELFQQDRIHNNAAGNEIYAQQVRGFLQR